MTKSILQNLGSSLLFSLIGYFVLIVMSKQFIDFYDIFLIGLIFFAAYSVVTFILSKRLLSSGKKQAFFGLTIMSMLLKIVTSFVVVAAYVAYAQPSGKLFILPFLLTYMVFTIFETIYLSRLSLR